MKESPKRIEIESVAQFRSFYDPMSEVVVLFDPVSYTLLAANEAFLQLSPAESRQKVTAAILSECKRLALQKGKTVTVSLSVKAGETMQLLLKGSPAVFQQAEVLLGVGKNLSDLKELEGKLENAEAEKKVLLNEVYHRVNNNLNLIVSLLSLQINRIEEREIRHLLLESKSRVLTLALLQQKIHKSPRISQVKVSDYLTYLGARILSNFKAEAKGIRLKHEIESCWLNVDALVPLGLITNELVTNSIAHAFPLVKEGEISITLKKASQDRFFFQVKDNGIGLPHGNDLNDYPEHLGFQLVQSLGKQLNAETTVQTGRNKGVGISLHFSLRNYECP